MTGKEDVYTLGALLYHALAGEPLPESGLDLADLPAAIELPGVPQLLADVLAPAEERLDLEALYQRLLALRARQTDQPIALEVASATTVGLESDAAGERGLVRVRHLDGRRSFGAPTTAHCSASPTGWAAWRPARSRAGTAVNTVMRSVAETAAGRCCVTPAETESVAQPRPLDPVALIRRAATAVHAAAQGRQLGTTITCVAVQDGELTLGHVGDTRAYLLRGGVLTQLTADHSLVAAMVASGVISRRRRGAIQTATRCCARSGASASCRMATSTAWRRPTAQPRLRLALGDWLHALLGWRLGQRRGRARSRPS